jgi:hypothetical protein
MFASHTWIVSAVWTHIDVSPGWADQRFRYGMVGTWPQWLVGTPTIISIKRDQTIERKDILLLDDYPLLVVHVVSFVDQSVNSRVWCVDGNTEQAYGVARVTRSFPSVIPWWLLSIELEFYSSCDYLHNTLLPRWTRPGSNMYSKWLSRPVRPQHLSQAVRIVSAPILTPLTILNSLSDCSHCRYPLAEPLRLCVPRNTHA